MQENLSSGFLTKYGWNQPAQLQKLAKCFSRIVAHLVKSRQTHKNVQPYFSTKIKKSQNLSSSAVVTDACELT